MTHSLEKFFPPSAMGRPELDGLRANRMPHRWVASDSLRLPDPLLLPPPADGLLTTQSAHEPIALHCEFDALPFPDNSLDLVVLPHALELARDPHRTLREVERVLVPEGRVVIAGFNPASLWSLRQRAGRLRRGMGFGCDRRLYRPDAAAPSLLDRGRGSKGKASKPFRRGSISSIIGASHGTTVWLRFAMLIAR